MEQYLTPIDIGRNPLPHYKSNRTDLPELIQGHGGAIKVIGPAVREPFTGSSSMTHTFSERMSGFFISNDGEGTIVITIDQMEISVYAGETFRESFDPFTVVSISASTPFRAWGLL